MLSFFNILMHVSILWSNDVVKIPVGESLENYKYMPEAQLYLDDKLVEDRLMYYEYEINFTSFGVIRTNVIGNYTVWYRVHFPTLGFESDAAITFVVYDHIAPEISGSKDFYVDVGTKSIDYKSLVTYKDNYDIEKDLTLTIYSAQVNLNQVETYEVTYSVKDKNLNETLWVQYIHVVDRVKPVVKQKSQVEVSVGQKLDLDKYFSFSDNYDTVLHISLDDSLVNYQIPKNYPATLYVKDQSGNEMRYEFNIQVIDMSAPKIYLKTNHIKIEYQSTLTDMMLKSYIFSVEDNLDTLHIDDIIITSYVDTNYLGSYEVRYHITDSNQLKGEAKLTVEVADMTAPTIILLEEIIVNVGELEPYIFNYLKIYDNYSSYDDLTITKTGTISMSKTGLNRVIVKVVDKAKNQIEFPVIVHVVDNVPPKLEIPLNIIITDFLKPNYKAFMEVTDNYDKDLNIIVSDAHIDYSKVGIYELDIIVTDGSNNQTTKTIIVEIKDLSYPEIILTTHQIYIPYGTKEMAYLNYVEAIFDSYDKDLNISDILVTTKLDLEKVGLYQVEYKLVDKSLNVGSAILYVYVSDYEQPTIEMEPIVIKVGQHFNYLNYVYAFDNYDGDITHLVKMNPSFIPLHEPGYYEVIFYVHDTSGNYAEVKGLLTIETAFDILDYIYYIAGAILLVGGVVVYYLYMKKREKI